MAIALRRQGRFAPYFVEATPADITSPTLNDPEAAEALPVLRHEVELPPPAPVYETVPAYETVRPRRGVAILAVSLVANVVLLEIVVRLVGAVGR